MHFTHAEEDVFETLGEYDYEEHDYPSVKKAQALLKELTPYVSLAEKLRKFLPAPDPIVHETLEALVISKGIEPTPEFLNNLTLLVEDAIVSNTIED
jgi:hypothetical protein